MNEFKNILGYRKQMNNGLFATCIAYRHCKDIDIQFDDGVILEHKRKDSFLSGCIRHPNYKHNSSLINRANCEGLTIMQRCGMKATCIAYRGSHDIDIRFEDGTIVKNKAKYAFVDGQIENPNISSFSLPQKIIWYVIHSYFPDAIWNYRPNWLKNPNTNMPLEIDIWIPSLKYGIEYDGYEFHKENEPLSRLKRDLIANSKEIKRLFTFLERGSIEHYSDKHINIQLKHQSTTREYKQLLEELKIKINEVLILLGVEKAFEFKDDFIKTVIETKVTLIKEKEFVPESRKMKNGQIATIIAYRNSKNIDLMFEDGTIVSKISLSNFKRGFVRNPNYNPTDCVGIVLKQHCGMNAECVAYRNTNDIDVKFEDGLIVRNVTKGDFYKRTIRNPNLIGNKLSKGKVSDYIGTTVLQHCGMKATCTEYFNASNITIKFEDGLVLHKQRKYSFENGIIKNPNSFSSKIIGLEKMMNCGMMATVIAYRSAYHMTIRFEDGTIIQDVSKPNFDKGQISHPKIDKYQSRKKTCLGMVIMQHCGMKAECISYKRNDNIDVKFEDGTIVCHRKKDEFLKGGIRNPSLKIS